MCCCVFTSYISILLSILFRTFTFSIRKWQYYRLIVTLLQIDVKNAEETDEENIMNEEFILFHYSTILCGIYTNYNLHKCLRCICNYCTDYRRLSNEQKEAFHFFYQFNLCRCVCICRSVLKNTIYGNKIMFIYNWFCGLFHYFSTKFTKAKNINCKMLASVRFLTHTHIHTIHLHTIAASPSYHNDTKK